MTKSAVLKAVRKHRQKKERIVFTNGCFDILHIGHMHLLKEARNLGDVLVVGINSDDSVRRLKGKSRPIVPELERKEILLSLKPVDYVCIFKEDTPLKLLKQIRPDILVKGGDWAQKKIIGNDFMSSIGGKTLSISFVTGYSSTSLIKRIKRRN